MSGSLLSDPFLSGSLLSDSLLSDYEMAALLLSLKVSTIAVIASLPLGIVCAWLLARIEFPGKAIFDSLIHLPLVLPPVVVGYLLLITMGRKGVIGQFLFDWFGLSFSFSWRGAALASAIVAFPLMVRAIRQSFETVDLRLEQAARTLGSSRWRVFVTITLPLTSPGIVSGMIIAFARSLGEFGSTITFVSNIPGETRTIPLAMYSFIETPGAEYQAMRLCIISIVIALMSLLASQWLTNKALKRTASVC
ncbi:molybdate ABC transporter permease subunit [Shewanella sp.]|uniref:molybdate ABC transporter permease subunit n=1 Tax=Shewanella sp. TaxID=50422 RepID=UPI00262345DE|nr:molybdate ABC transporter permease subunit [Shewanella sp.]